MSSRVEGEPSPDKGRSADPQRFGKRPRDEDSETSEGAAPDRKRAAYDGKDGFFVISEGEDAPDTTDEHHLAIWDRLQDIDWAPLYDTALNFAYVCGCTPEKVIQELQILFFIKLVLGDEKGNLAEPDRFLKLLWEAAVLNTQFYQQLMAEINHSRMLHMSSEADKGAQTIFSQLASKMFLNAPMTLEIDSFHLTFVVEAPNSAQKSELYQYDTSGAQLRRSIARWVKKNPLNVVLYHKGERIEDYELLFLAGVRDNDVVNVHIDQ